MKYIMLLHGLPNKRPTPFDNTYLVEYDPTRDGTDPFGDRMNCHLVTTHDPTKALALEFTEFQRMLKWGHGKRIDSMPNRPLTAFSISFLDAESLEKVC